MRADVTELFPGLVASAALAPVRSREQGGHRQVVIAAHRGYLAAVTSLALVIPVTTVDRGWPNHIRLVGEIGLDHPSWGLTEQVRTISRSRLTRVNGHVATGCLQDIWTWLADFLDLSTR